MNRMTLLEAGLSDGSDLQSRRDDPSLDLSCDRQSSPHQLLYPASYEPAYAYPLVIWLHGCGDDERQLLDVMPFVSEQNFVSIAPRGVPRDSQPASGRRACYWQQSPDGIDHALEAVTTCLAYASQRVRIAESRVFLAGFADGGTMALRLAFAHPELFAGVATLNGPFPEGHRPIRSFTRCRSLKVLLSFGRESRLCPPERAAHDLRLLYATGATLMVRQYESDDCPTTVMLADLNRWMMEHVTGQQIDSGDTPSLARGVDCN